MTTFFTRYTAPLALLLSLFMFSGVVSSTVVFADQGAPKQCCDDDPTPSSPANDGECIDCGCLGCFALHPGDTLNATPAVTSVQPPWLIRTYFPAAYLRSIDYPPETV